MNKARKHHQQFGFIDPDCPPPKMSRGARWIIVHAITKDGLLFTRTNGLYPDAEPVDAEDNSLNTTRTMDDKQYKERELKAKKPDTNKVVAKRILDGPTKCLHYSKWKLVRHIVNSCECFYPAYSNSADYHDNMDGDMFMLWVENRLIPAFEAKYGYDMKMVLILDNAPYHWGHSDDFINTNETTKKFTEAFLKTKYFEENGGLFDDEAFKKASFEVTVSRTVDGKTYDVEYKTFGQVFKNFSAKNALNPDKCGLSVAELREAFGDWLDLFAPEKRKTELQNFFETYRNGFNNDVQHELLLTPPEALEMSTLKVS
eukprot:TRINITY_DN4549_c0_g3_i2.p1 TRINITY_DN4549_c0_g3~~TRINITY_DN4549_c0_g3_i2.p1  ORF type:complete len:315 (-),score=88.54 TRINITY_DN4549_c0_g3_i2:209-1153(-)